MKRILWIVFSTLILTFCFVISAYADTQFNVGDIIKLGCYQSARIDDVESLTLNEEYIACDYYYCLHRNSSSVYFPYEERYYKFEPISFEVISNDDNKIIAISREIIEAKPYNNVYTEVEWDSSSLSYYLKNEFKNMAFSDKESNAIYDIRVLSEQEFDKYTFERTALATEYMETKHQLFTPGKADCWWLKSDISKSKIPFVNADGKKVSEGVYADAEYIGIRPVIEFSTNHVKSIDEDGNVEFKEQASMHIEENTLVLEPIDKMQNTILIIAIYDDTQLTDVYMHNVNVESGEKIELENIYKFSAERRLVNVLWWEDLENMVPIGASIIMDKTKYGINVIETVNQSNGITVFGNMYLAGLEINEKTEKLTPWNPVEITLSVYDESGKMIYFDQTTADNYGDYRFNFKLNGYKGHNLTVKINNAYGCIAEKTFASEN